MAEAETASVEALEMIYRTQLHRYVRVAQAITRSRESAIDAVQEAFASVLQNRRAFRGDGPLEAWVWRAVLNAARMDVRKLRPDSVEEPLAVAANGHHADDGLRAAIAALPERQRLVLFLRHYADLDYRAIADALEIEIGTVGATLSQARANLRTQLAEVED